MREAFPRQNALRESLAEEGVTQLARGRTFALAIGRPVRFAVVASDEHVPLLLGKPLLDAGFAVDNNAVHSPPASTADDDWRS